MGYTGVRIGCNRTERCTGTRRRFLYIAAYIASLGTFESVDIYS